MSKATVNFALLAVHGTVTIVPLLNSSLQANDKSHLVNPEGYVSVGNCTYIVLPDVIAPLVVIFNE